MSGIDSELWFNNTYEETYAKVARAGKILLAYLCPALQCDRDELLFITYEAMYKKREKLRSHPNIVGWLIVAYRYEVYHRIRSWYRRRDALERLQRQAQPEPSRDFLQEAFACEEVESLLRDAIGAERYSLLRAYHVEGAPIRELANRRGTTIHGMEASLSRWKKRCVKVLQGKRKLLLVICWISVNFPLFRV